MKRLLLSFALLLFSISVALAADEHVYIDTDSSTCPGDGSTGDPYCSLSEWETNAAINIPAVLGDGFNHYAHFKGVTNADTTKTTISGSWVTDANNRIVLMTDTASTTPDENWDTGGRNTGATYSTSHYRLEITAAANNDTSLLLNDGFIDVIGLQFKMTNASSYTGTKQLSYSFGSDTDHVIAYNRFTAGDLGSATHTAFYVVDANFTGEIYNNVFEQIEDSGGGSRAAHVYCDTTGTGCEFQNNTFANVDDGIYRQGGLAYLSNNLFFAVVDPCSGTISGGQDNAITNASDADCPSTGLETSVSTTDAVDLTDCDNDPADCSVVDGSTKVEDTGATDPYSMGFTDDVIGVSRSTYTPWDIGAFEEDTAAGAARNRIF